MTLLLGGWQSPLPFLAFIPSYVWFFAKVCAVAVSMVWVRATLPRLRIDHLLAFAWKFMLPMSFVTLLAAAAWYYAGQGALAWGISAAIVIFSYLLFGTFCFTRRHSATNRRYLFSE